MADRKARPQQQGWSALTKNAQRQSPLLQGPLIPSFSRELPPPDPSQFTPLSSHPPLPIPATIPSFAAVLNQQYEYPLHNDASSLLSACHGRHRECSRGSDAIEPLDFHALAVSRLHACHSWADVTLISDIFQALDLDEYSTSAYLLSMSNDNMNRFSASDDGERPAWTQGNDDGELVSAREETSLHSQSEQRDFGLDAEGRDSSSFLNPVPSEPDWEVDDIYLSSRRDALKMSRASGKHARGAYNAFMGGDYSKAKVLSKQAREERAEAEKMHAEAAKQILQARNGENLWHLDLHGLHANEAVAALQQRLLEIETAFLNPSCAEDVSTSHRSTQKLRPCHGPALHGLPFTQELKVITGVGNHSRGGGSLPMAIQSFLTQNRYKFEESKPGVVAVRPKFQFLKVK